MVKLILAGLVAVKVGRNRRRVRWSRDFSVLVAPTRAGSGMKIPSLASDMPQVLASGAIGSRSAVAATTPLTTIAPAPLRAAEGGTTIGFPAPFASSTGVSTVTQAGEQMAALVAAGVGKAPERTAAASALRTASSATAAAAEGAVFSAITGPQGLRLTLIVLSPTIRSAVRPWPKMAMPTLWCRTTAAILTAGHSGRDQDQYQPHSSAQLRFHRYVPLLRKI